MGYTGRTHKESPGQRGNATRGQTHQNEAITGGHWYYTRPPQKKKGVNDEKHK